MIFKKTEVDAEGVRNLKNRYGIDTLFASILIRRGITAPEDIKFYLEDDIRFLHNPYLFKDMEDVIDRLHMAKEEEEKVLVFGDKDVDGVTSSVILYESLKMLELDLSWRVPTGSDSYGLSIQTVEDVYKNDITLIITVDCGISAFDAIKRARELGIDIIILDHHIPRNGILPDANFIINPKVPYSTYPFKGLAACGVVSKVIWALCFSLIDTLYKSGLCFLHFEESENGIKPTIVKLYNLCEVGRFYPTDVAELLSILQGEQILVYGEKAQKDLFQNYIAKKIDINVIDIQPEIERVITGVVGQPLQNLLNLSKMKLYANNDFLEIDLIISLFTTYIDRRYFDKFKPFIDTLDLVALGTVADLMPLIGENRILVKKGLSQLSRCSRSGLQALLLKQNLLGQSISSKDISWNLAPVINSAGRMKKADIAVELLLGEDPDQKNKLTLDILALNKERRSISESLWGDNYNELHEAFDEFKQKLVFLYSENMVKGVSGIIAARTLSTFNVPGIILAKEGDSITGSIRSNGGLNINELFNRCSDLLIEWGGHSCAAGFNLDIKNLLPLKKRILKLLVSGEIITDIKKNSDTINIDATIPTQYLAPNIIDIVDKFEPYGEENKNLVFFTPKTKLLDINFMGKTQKTHLKLLIEVGEYKWPAIFWNSADRAGVDFTKGDEVDIYYRVERNFYGGNETLQLNVLDIIK